jgi:tetratricopeptide (TPR) repeat protein
MQIFSLLWWLAVSLTWLPHPIMSSVGKRSTQAVICQVLLAVLCCLSQVVYGQEPDDRAETVLSGPAGFHAPDSLFRHLQELYSHSLEKKDMAAAGKALQQMGNLCCEWGNYPKALDFHQKADRIFREAGRTDLRAVNLNDIGVVYYRNRRLPLAQQQHNEALALCSALGNKKGVADTYGFIGHLYEKQKRYDSAFYFQRMALQQYQLLHEQKGIAKTYENLGSIYEDLERVDSATWYYTHSFNLYTALEEQEALTEVLNNLGDLYRKTGRYAEAMLQTRLALAQAEKMNNLHEQGAAYRDLGKTFYLLHEPDSAYHYLELSRRVSIDLYSVDNNRQTAFLSALYEVDKKNEAITGLEHERDINIVIAVATAIVLVLLVVLGWVTISRQRLKIRHAAMEALQHRRQHQAQQQQMQSVLNSKEQEEERLKQDLEVKARELTSHTLQAIQKNQVLEEVRTRLEAMAKDDKRDQRKQVQQLIQHINLSFNYDEYWNEFKESFENVHQHFFVNLKKQREDLTANDFRLASLIKLNLSSKDMATLLAISQDSLRVSRYRLKKKLGLEEGESLTAFIHSL